MKKEGRDTVDAYCVDGYLVSTPLPREFECERREGEMHKEWEKGRIKKHTIEGNFNILNSLFSFMPHGWV